jgi:pyruvate/2-oxoglutarate dehydrogenase complex dihydrolipoamide dehydrogenase (E3) component
MEKEILVIGGGPAGIEAAREAVKSGLSVTMVSAGPVGGRAGWHSLLPSKVWLAAAEEAQHGPSKTRSGPAPVDARAILGHLAAVKEAWNGQERASLDDLGVKVLQGTAVFAPGGVIRVLDGDEEATSRFKDIPAIVASGSVPVFPAALKPDGRRVIAPRLLSKLAQLPQNMLVIGAGATGCEAAYLFNALGVSVTWIVDQFGILPRFAPQVGEVLGDALRKQGVAIVSGEMVADLEREETRVTAVLTGGARYEAQMAFVAVGRRPDLDQLNLAAAGLEAGADGRIHIDEYGRTRNPSVYLVGDADGGVMTANKAQAQGRIAARRLAGKETAPYDERLVIQPVYTEPQAAQVGDVSGGTSLPVPFSQSLKAHLLSEGEGFLQLYFDETGDRILGAAAVGPHAADVLSPVLMALKLGGRLEDLAALYAAYPSLSELPFSAAREVK